MTNETDWQALVREMTGTGSIAEIQRSMNTSLYASEMFNDMSRIHLDSLGINSAALSAASYSSGLEPVQNTIDQMFRQQSSITTALEAAGVNSSIVDSLGADSFLQQIGPQIPESALGILHQDIAMNSSALAAFESAAASVTGAWADLINDQVSGLANAYSGFLEDLVESTITVSNQAIAHRLASQAVQVSSAAFVRLSDTERLVGANLPSPIFPNVFSHILVEADGSGSAATVPTPGTGAARVEYPSAKIIEIATSIHESRNSINEITAIKFGEPTFKSTNRTENATFYLALVVVDSSESFFEFCERLFEYTYESSGTFNRLSSLGVRYPVVMNRVKHFRLYAAHDIDHGTEKDIEKKRLQVGDHFQGLIGKRFPETPQDWTHAQIKLMVELAAFLETTHQAALTVVSPQA